MSSYLCKVYRSALFGRDYHKYEKKDTEAIFMTFALLEKSAADGCPVCSQLLNIFSPQYWDHHREAARKSTNEQKKKSSVKFSFSHWVPHRGSPRVELYAKSMPWHRLYLVPAEQVESFIDSREISPSTGSAQSLATAIRMLGDCMRQHPSCAACSTTFNPTRLIDLGLGEIPQPRLYEVLADCGKLALESIKTMIPVSELSRTLQDAMTVVRKLGIQYLWVDTLCIVQDSITDWQGESTRIGDVYKNSTCTIAASAASNGDVGCFFKRDPRLIEPCKIQNPSLQGLEELYCMDPNTWKAEIEDAALNHRGWVLQELLLSPRTLHFGRNQIFYKCREIEACEAFPKGLPKIIRNGSVEMISSILTPLKHNHWEGDSMFAWDQIVEYYSNRQLTNGEDKLVAVSGLAKEMRLILEDEYLAGIWRKTLPWGLLWSIFSTDVFDTVRFPGCRAPSWSWASIDGKISTTIKIGGNSKYIDLAEVQEVCVTSSVGDAITHVTDGFIRLKGRLTTCWYNGMCEPIFGELWGITSTGKQKIEGTVEPDTKGPDNEVVGDLYCFPIMLTKQNEPSPEFDFTYCLLLQRAEDKGTFRRFGTFSSRWGRKEGTDLFSDACNVFDTSTKREDWEYEETGKGKKYIITII